MIDPSMEGYLPIPQRIAHEGPVEVILRFSTVPQTPDLEIQHTQFQSPGEVFLHAVGATATFGKPFSSSNTKSSTPSSPFTIHSGPIHLMHLQIDGCESFTLPPDIEDEVVIMLDRGGCPFLDKLVHASRAGAAGLIVAGLSPASAGGMGMIDPDGLIRPSADGDGKSLDLIKEVKGTGLIYVDWKTGDALRKVFDQSSTTIEKVMVEVMSLDGQSNSGSGDPPSDDQHSASSSGGQVREGRVGVGEHAIWNLRIVEAPP